MNYQVIALDIDGTVRNSKKEITPETKKVLMELQEQGAMVVVASGRCTYGVLPTAKELKLDQFGGYILTFNGCQALECKTGQIIDNHYLPLNFVEKAHEFSKSIGCTFLLYDDMDVVSDNPENPHVQYEARINGMGLRKVEDFSVYNGKEINECFIAGEPENIKKVIPEAEKLFGDSANIFRSEPYYLTFIPLGTEKGNGLKAILEYHNIPREASIAFGDGYNDISMIQYAGLGVAMENAEEPIKQAADFVTKSCDEDGVAYALHKFM